MSKSKNPLVVTGEVIGNRERVWKEASKIYKQYLSSSSASSLQEELEYQFTRLHKIMSKYTSKPPPLKDREYLKIMLAVQNHIYNDVRMVIFDQFLHSKSYFKWCSEIQKTKLEEKQINSDNTWYETFKAGGESTVYAWKQFQLSKTVDNVEYDDSAVMELRSSSLIPMVLDELEAISAYGGEGSRVKKRRPSKIDYKNDAGGGGEEEAAANEEDVEFSVGEFVSSTSKLSRIEKELDKTHHMLDVVAILHAKIKSDTKIDKSPTSATFYNSQFRILGL